MIQVLIVATYPMVRAGLRALLEDAEDIAVVGEAPGDEGLVALAGELSPDVVLLEIDGGGPSLAEQIEQLGAGIGVLVLRGGQEAAPGAPPLGGGRGYLLKDVTGEELAAAVRAVHQGLIVLHPAFVRSIAELSVDPAVRGNKDAEALTARERQVLTLVAHGLPNKTIAARLHLSEHTVKFHVASIIAKLGVASRTEAVSVALRRGLIAL